jgi:hypothetical protein
MAGGDTMKLTILADGTIKTETDPISPANHDSAEAFLKAMAKLAGGETIRVAKPGTHHHHEHNGLAFDISKGLNTGK